VARLDETAATRESTRCIQEATGVVQEGRRLTFGSLFAGIGGMDLGLERAGLACKWQVEIDPYCRRVLAKHWPDVPRHDDVRTFPPSDSEDWSVDVIAGGFPCQDISFAGKGAGLSGERSGLWFEFARCIRDLRPRYVVVENVAALLVRGLDAVLGTLASIGYDAEWDCLQADAFGAPHERDRTFLVAYPVEVAGWRSVLLHGCDDLPRDQQWSPAEGVRTGGGWKRWLSEACQALDGTVSSRDFCGVDDGLSSELDRIGALGNAVVPQIAEFIGRRLIEFHATLTAAQSA
jgi:DNA (cytosine-5)-methyltransferase 1